MQWSDLTTALGDLLQYPITNAASQTPSSDNDFNNILPRITEAGEQRIYREIDFLATREEDHSVTLSTSSRDFTLPAAILIIQSANVITPASTVPAVGTRNPLLVVSKEFIDQVWPQENTGNTVPEYLALLSATTGIVAPTADQAYELEITGIYRPAPISATNTSTYISLTYPDLFVYACMVFAMGFQRDFSAQSQNQDGAVSWEQQYQEAKKSVLEEEQRRKSQAPNWSPFSATPQSSPRP